MNGLKKYESVLIKINKNIIFDGLIKTMSAKETTDTHTKPYQLHELTPYFFWKRLPSVECGLNFSYKITIKRSILCIIICIACIYIYMYMYKNQTDVVLMFSFVLSVNVPLLSVELL